MPRWAELRYAGGRPVQEVGTKLARASTQLIPKNIDIVSRMGF